MLNKNKEFIKEIKIDKKKRFRFNLITLVIFNLLLLSSLVFMSTLIPNVVTYIVSGVIFIGCVIGSINALLRTPDNKKCVIYRDKISIESTTYTGEIDMSKIFMAKARRSIFDVLLKRSAHTLVLYEKNKLKEIYIISFIAEDVETLCDEIMKLAIEARGQNLNKDNDLVQEEILANKNEKVDTEKVD